MSTHVTGNTETFNRRNDWADACYDTLDDMYDDNWIPGSGFFRNTFKLDVKETDSEYFVEAELPGVKDEEIEIFGEGDILHIIVNRQDEDSAHSEDYIHRERHINSMSRSICLENAQTDELETRHEDGVLYIVMPKMQKIAIAL